MLTIVSELAGNLPKENNLSLFSIRKISGKIHWIPESFESRQAFELVCNLMGYVWRRKNKQFVLVSIINIGGLAFSWKHHLSLINEAAIHGLSIELQFFICLVLFLGSSKLAKVVGNSFLHIRQLFSNFQILVKIQRQISFIYQTYFIFHLLSMHFIGEYSYFSGIRGMHPRENFIWKKRNKIQSIID